MRQGTTPEIIFTSSSDMSNYQARINFVQGENALVIDNDRIERDGAFTLKIKLTQEETLSFVRGRLLNIQLDIVDEEGNAMRSEVINTTIEKALNDEVISYGD